MPEKKGWAEKLDPANRGYFWPTFYDDPYSLCISKYGKVENGIWKSEELMYHCEWCSGGGSVIVEKPVAELASYCKTKDLALPKGWDKVVAVYEADNNWNTRGSGKVPMYHTIGKAWLVDLAEEAVAGAFEIQLLHHFVRENKPPMMANAGGKKFERYESVPGSRFDHKPKVEFDESFDLKKAEQILHRFEHMVPMAVRLRERCDAEEKGG